MARKVTRAYRVTGMDCGHCVTRVASAVREHVEVQMVTVDRPSGMVTVVGDDIDDAIVCDVITAAGYTVLKGTP